MAHAIDERSFEAEAAWGDPIVDALLDQPVFHSAIFGETQREPFVARVQWAALSGFEQNARGDAGFVPAGVEFCALHFGGEYRIRSELGKKGRPANFRGP